MTKRIGYVQFEHPLRGQNRLAVIVHIGAALRVIDVRKTSFVESFGPVLGAFVNVLDPALLGPAVSSSMPYAIVGAVIAAKGARRRLPCCATPKRQNANRENDCSAVRHLDRALEPLGDATGSLLRFHDLVTDRVPHQSSRRGKIELAHHSRAMRLHRLEAYAEKQRNLLVRMTFGDQLNHAALSVRQHGGSTLGVP